MREFHHSRSLKIISVIVLSFFIWSFGGVFDIAYAIKNSEELGVRGEGAKQQSKQQTALNSQSKTQRPEEKFQKTIKEIESLVEGVRKAGSAEEQKSEKDKLKTKKAALETLDIEIRKQFKDTEGRIKDLPEVIKQRHRDFVKKYDENLNELRSNLEAIDKAKDKAEVEAKVEKARKHLEKVRPPKRHQKLDPNKLPHETLEIKNFEKVEKKNAEIDHLIKSASPNEDLIYRKPILIASNGSLAGLLAQSTASTITRQTSPTEADLAETIEVKLTPEIRAKAQELGSNPVRIYEFVRNSVTFEPYYGSLKGAQQTLAELAGNDMDQASLLIALLRAANVPARYNCGTIELEMDRLMNWVGVKDANTAATILATNGIPGTLITEGGALKYAQFSHCWVEAYVDMFPSMGAVNKKGSYWTPIDPSFKETVSAESINISKTVPFDETTYINTGDDMPPVLSYIYKLKDYYNTNYDYNFMKIFHVAVTDRKEFGIFMGTLPYEIISEQRYSEIPDTKRHKITLSLSSSDSYDTNTTSITKTYPEIAGKKLTISYTPALSQDQTVINNYGGLLRTPAYLLRVKAEIKLNNETILTGPEMGMGASLSLTTMITSPNLSKDIKTTDISRGISYAIGLPALTYPGTQLVQQIDAMRVLEGTLHDSINAMDSRAGELLQNIAIEYFGQLNNTSRSIEGVMHVQLTKMPSIALVSADADYNYVFGFPISPPIMGGLGIDAIRVASSPMPVDGDLNQRKEFIKQRGLNSSYLEHKILENLLGIESISAVKALQIAAKNGTPIYTINKSNIDSVFPMLTISNDDKADIQNAVYAGKEIIVSRDNITLYDWTGVGYIVRDPNTGTGSYMISSSLSGGGTAKASNPAFDREQKVAWFITGQDLNKNTYAWAAMRSLTVLTAVLPIWQKFGYIPSFVLDADEEWVKYAANNNQTWIFYYAGHGSANNTTKTDFLEPKKNVVPSDINSNAKIVFLNSCKSMSNGSFIPSFHIDGKYSIGGKDFERAEAIIGFTDTSVIFIAEEFAFEFWLLMGTGLTVNEAKNVLMARASTLPALYELYRLNYLRIVPDDNPTTLIP
jgi:hypothetical protein